MYACNAVFKETFTYTSHCETYIKKETKEPLITTQILSYLISKYNMFQPYKAIIRYYNYRIL